MSVRAVVFDLWGTLVRWPDEESKAFRERWARRLGVSGEQLEELWHGAGAYEERESAPLAPVLRKISGKLGARVDVDELMRWRLDLARRALVPDPGVVETLVELRERGVLLGLVSNCTEDVALVWPETRFAPLFDAAVFSATSGCLKPSREIYELACDRLGVEPSACLFVGDGANDELGGAERAGMTPVLVLSHGAQAAWRDVEQWSGMRVTSIPGVLELMR